MGLFESFESKVRKLAKKGDYDKLMELYKKNKGELESLLKSLLQDDDTTVSLNASLTLDKIEFTKEKEESDELLKEGERALMKAEIGLEYSKELLQFYEARSDISRDLQANMLDESKKAGQHKNKTSSQETSETDKVYKRHLIKTLELKDDDDADELLNKAQVLHDLGEYEKAIVYYDRVIKLDSEYVVPQVNKATALNMLGRYEKAIECCNQVIKIDSECADAWYVKGHSLGRLGMYEDEIKCYIKAIKLDPEGANKQFSLEAKDVIQMNKFSKKLDQWEDEGYEVSEFRDKWLKSDKGT